MQEAELRPNRWFRLDLEDGDDLKGSLLEWARDRGVDFGFLRCVGELRDVRIASGYRESGGEKNMVALDSNVHVSGQGTLIRSGEREEVHLHGSAGRKTDTLTGCWADRPRVYRGMTVLVTELEPTP